MVPAVVFAVALTARLVHLWALRDTPAIDVLMSDARAYDAWAQRLAAGDWVGSDVFYQAPLYPYLLGVVYAVLGRDLLIVRVIQALVGALAAALLAAAGTRLFGRSVGLLAGLGLALYAPAIFLDSLLQKSVLDVAFVCLVLWTASRVIETPARPWPWFGLGLALGALSLTRENALALVAVAVGWSLLAARRPATAREDRPERRDVSPGVTPAFPLQPTVALLAGLTLLLLPVAARNYAVTGGFYLTTSQFGPNFFIGNNPDADGTYMALRPGRGAPEFERADATALAERAEQRTLTPAEVSSYWTGRALAFITGEPAAWLRLMARKTALLWNRSEMLDTESQETYEDWSPLLRGLAWVGHFGVLVPLALVGLVAAWPQRRRLWPVVAMAAAYAASVVLFYVFARYRFPLVPFLLLFAAAGLVATPRLWRTMAPRRRLALVAVTIIVAAGVNIPMLSAARMRAITATNLGTALHEAGRHDDAVRQFEAAVALQPDYAPAYNNLGVTLRAQGRTDEAIAAYQRGLRLQDGYADLHFNLANALLAQNRADEAAVHLRLAADRAPADSAGAHNNLGTALAGQGQYAEAAAEFRAAIALDPESSLAHRNLGNVLASVGLRDEALAALRQAVTLAPADAAARYDYGSVLLEAARLTEAEAEFRAALGIDPRSVAALNNLGITLASQGRLDEATTLFERALSIDPGFADAQRNLATARAARRP
jgi:tetratricopeptide (TPR) repeat protein